LLLPLLLLLLAAAAGAAAEKCCPSASQLAAALAAEPAAALAPAAPLALLEAVVKLRGGPQAPHCSSPNQVNLPDKPAAHASHSAPLYLPHPATLLQ
jgi:hypothetical protein